MTKKMRCAEVIVFFAVAGTIGGDTDDLRQPLKGTTQRMISPRSCIT